MGYTNIKLYGGQICDYLYLQKTPVNNSNFKYIDSEPQIWDENTLLLSNFNNNLVAGNSSLTDSIVGYEVRRKRGSASHTEYVGKIGESGVLNNKKFVIDYAVVNNSEYTYYLYPSSEKSGSGVVLSPMITDEVKPDWSYWTLLVVDETEEDNVFYLNKMFKFELNLTEDDMNNNASVTITQNFTKYPTIQYGTSNYWSGSLSSLCGFISCDDVEYVQTPNMINELKALTSDTRRKFLKNTDGDIWEVKVSAPINISTEPNIVPSVKAVKISWCEIGDASNISIINNPNIPSVRWVLTDTGESVPYVEYIWDEHYRWDNSYKWTAKEDLLETDISNMGRDLFSKDGDE